VLETWLADETLQAIGAENLFAETAFLVPDETGAADWELRWFTPEVEIRLCGHATLASGHVLLGRPDLFGGGERVTFRTRQAGILEVRKRAEGGLELALPVIPTAPGEWTDAVAGLGAVPLEIWRSPDRYSLFLFGSEAEVRALRPDVSALAALGDDQFICTAPGTATDVVSRVFVPGAGVDEDSVTGSAHAVLTPFWAARLGRDAFTAHQASARGGDLTCRLAKEPGGDQVWLGGLCVTVVEGTFYLDG
jgi:predicted PhzF superfamily epimerase YddE/YHI9